MKQKIIIGFSVALLLAAVYLIARDLFHSSLTLTETPCCGDDLTTIKKVDSSLVGYNKIRIIPTGLKNLSGIAVNEEGKIYVCGNAQINVFDSAGLKTNRLDIDTIADCIAINGSDIYLGVGAGILHYNLSGSKIAFWKPSDFRGQITSIAVNGNFVYAADAVKKRVLKYTPEGKLVLEIGKKDSTTGATGFILPSSYFDIAFGSFNDLWIANTGRLRIENYTTNGHFQSSWGISSFSNNGFGGCCNPAHFTILPDGSFVTYEKGVDKIKLFDPTGRFLCIVAGAGSFKGNADFQLGNNHLVKDIASGTDGTVYVLDAYNQINIFRKKNL
jgi:hypothetical protein